MDLMRVMNGRKQHSRLAIWIAAFIFLCSLPVHAQLAADPQVAVQQGMELEGQRQWKGAIDHYKKSLKDYPDQESLVRGLRRAQFQFSIARRYEDKTFVSSLKPMTLESSLALYDDVIVNIQSHYVDSMTSTTLAAHGTESLWLALGNEQFLEDNLFGAPTDRLEMLRRTLFEKYWNKPVNGQAAARQMIIEVAKLCQDSVGLAPGAVVMEYVFGACNSLDDYSNVLSPGRKQDLFGNIKGEFVGIGIVMEALQGQGMRLSQVLPGSPAAEAGLQRGDLITTVDRQDVRAMSTEQAATLLAGQQGTQVNLEVKRNETQVLNVNCMRREVRIRSIPLAKIIDPQQGIGYIQMTGFQQSTVTELDEALQQLSRQGMKTLIWDLRENPGGLLTAAIEVCDRFVEQGVLVSTRGRTSDQTMSYSARGPGTWNVKLVLLIDENSASASEIVAGAIKDHKRGLIVGRKSFGKWSVQSIYDSRYATAVRLTTAKFYSPNGNTYGKIGIEPDVVVQSGSYVRRLGEVDLVNDPDIVEAMRQIAGVEFTQR